MKALLKYSGWVVALLLCVAAGLLYLWGMQQAGRADYLATERSKQDAAMEELKLKVATLAKQQDQTAVASLPMGQTTPRMTPELSPAQPGLQSLTDATASQAKTGAGSPKDQAGKEDTATSLGSFLAKMLSGGAGTQILQMGAAAGVNLQYGQYFAEARLTPQVEQQVRDVIGQRLAAQQELGLKVLQGQVDSEEVQRTFLQKQQDTHAALAKVLAPQQLAALDAYETALPERLLRQSMDTQFSTLAPSLQPEARTRAIDVLLEEMGPALAEAQRNGMLSLGGSMLQNAQAALDAYTKARDRLGQELTADQMANVDRLFTQQEQVINTASSVLHGSER